jgi:hypothetical protein
MAYARREISGHGGIAAMMADRSRQSLSDSDKKWQAGACGWRYPKGCNPSDVV